MNLLIDLKNYLNELKEYCGGEREIQIFRELTKKFEEHIGNNINSVIKIFKKNRSIGEITIVLKGIDKTSELELQLKRLKKRS